MKKTTTNMMIKGVTRCRDFKPFTLVEKLLRIATRTEKNSKILFHCDFMADNVLLIREVLVWSSPKMSDAILNS